MIIVSKQKETLVNSIHVAAFYTEGCSLKARIYNGWVELGVWKTEQETREQLEKLKRIIWDSGEKFYEIN